MNYHGVIQNTKVHLTETPNYKLMADINHQTHK